MTDFFDDIDDDQPIDPGQAPVPQNIEIKTANGNVGAVRVAVPRRLPDVLKAIDDCAQQFGHTWLYSIPFKKKLRDGSEITQLVEGPTIGCALDVARCYGNCNINCERVEETKDGWIFHAEFLDIETGFRITRPFRQRKSQNIGNMGGDKARAEDVVFQIGASKAMRNVTRNALRGMIDEALRRGGKRLTAKIKNNMPAMRERIRSRCAENNIAETRLQAYYQKPLDDFEPHEIASLIKQFQALNEGLIDADQICPDAPRDAPKAVDNEPTGTGEVLDQAERELAEEFPAKAAARPKRVKLTFRKKEYGKTNYLRDIKQMIKRIENQTELAELARDHTTAMFTIEDEADRGPIDSEVQIAIGKAHDAILADLEEEGGAMDPDDPSIDEDTGEVLETKPKTFDSLV